MPLWLWQPNRLALPSFHPPKLSIATDFKVVAFHVRRHGRGRLNFRQQDTHPDVETGCASDSLRGCYFCYRSVATDYQDIDKPVSCILSFGTPPQNSCTSPNSPGSPLGRISDGSRPCVIRAVLWLFGPGLLGLIGIARKKAA